MSLAVKRAVTALFAMSLYSRNKVSVAPLGALQLPVEFLSTTYRLLCPQIASECFARPGNAVAIGGVVPFSRAYPLSRQFDPDAGVHGIRNLRREVQASGSSSSD